MERTGDVQRSRLQLRRHTPPTTILLAPSSILAEDQFVFVWMGFGVLAALAIVVRLRLF